MTDDRDLLEDDDVRASEPDPDPRLDEWLDDVASAVDDDLARNAVPWDFAAVLRRAHELDPKLVSAQAVSDAEQAEPVISLAQRRTQRATRDDPAFANLVQDVRAATEHDAAVRGAAAATVTRRVALGHGTGRVGNLGRMGRMGGLVLALAAVVVAGLGIVRGVQVLTERAEAPADAAVHQGGASSKELERAVIDDGEPTAAITPRPAPLAPAPLEALEAAPIEAAPIEAASIDAAPVVAARTPKKKSPRSPEPAPEPKPPEAKPPTLAERVATLDAEAHAAWKAGEFSSAEAKFEALIALAGKSRLADLAYGDLFTLARRRGDAAREVALWKRYLAALPRGRFADDARAGLCRKSASDEAACWREYLADFPEGSYRAQAERGLGGAP